MQNETGIPEPKINADGTAEQPAGQAGAQQAAGEETPEQVDAELGEAIDYPGLIAQLESELAEEKAKAAKLREDSQRMAAEFQNASRRKDKQVADEIERAGAHLVRRLLPVVDDFDLAFANVPADLKGDEPWVEGFRQIQKKLHGLLTEEGLQPIPTEGEFDPALHEAVTSEPSDSVESGHIIATLRTGYTYKGRVLRPALVRVAL